VCDPDVPLLYDRRVVALIDVDGSPAYFEGKVLTKHPAKAKAIDVQLANGGLVRRASKADLARVVGEYHRHNVAIDPRVRKVGD
jgi:hypothetical protein